MRGTTKHLMLETEHRMKLRLLRCITLHSLKLVTYPHFSPPSFCLSLAEIPFTFDGSHVVEAPPRQSFRPVAKIRANTQTVVTTEVRGTVDGRPATQGAMGTTPVIPPEPAEGRPRAMGAGPVGEGAVPLAQECLSGALCLASGSGRVGPRPAHCNFSYRRIGRPPAPRRCDTTVCGEGAGCPRAQ